MRIAVVSPFVAVCNNVELTRQNDKLAVFDRYVIVLRFGFNFAVLCVNYIERQYIIDRTFGYVRYLRMRSYF